MIQPVIDGAGKDGIVANALGSFLQDQQEGRITEIGQKFTNTVTCVVDAVNAYVAGDELMASRLLTASRDTPTFHGQPTR